MKLIALLSCLLGADYSVVANHGPAGTYCAFPGACRMADGRIIVVYYNGLGHVTTTNQRKGGGAIAYTISKDEGNTWSESQILLDTPKDDRDPSISLLRDGRLMLTYFRLITVPKLAGDGVYVAEIVDGSVDPNFEPQLRPGRSAEGTNPGVGRDGNRTNYHSETRLSPVHIRKLQHDAGTSSPLRDFGNGLLMLGSYHIDQPYVIRSADNGVTWQVFAIPNGGKHLDAETDVIELRADDSVLRLSRLGNRPLPARFYVVLRGSKCNGHYSTSTDGKNWMVAKDIGFPLHCPQLHRVELGVESPSVSNGKASQSAKATPPEMAIGTTAMQVPNSAILLAHRVPATSMHYSLDECKTWVGPIQVDSCGGAYPCFVTCKDGSVLVIYYTEGTNSDIRCRRFSLSKKGVKWQ